MKGIIGRSSSLKRLSREQLAKRARHREHTKSKKVFTASFNGNYTK